jgi:protoheme IX farnesyltransferase
MLPVVDVKGKRTAVETVIFTALLGAASSTPYLLGAAGPVYLTIAGVSSVIFLGSAVRMVRARGSRIEARRVLLTSIVYLPVVLGALVLDAVH